MENNLFKFAPSELSQDAFICWLINWINHKDENNYLRQTAELLLNTFFEKSNRRRPDRYETVKIKQQFEQIDILIVINGKHVVIVEDKTNTVNHSNQLLRYIKIVKESADKLKLQPDPNPIKIYFKTGNQSNFIDIREKGYVEFVRTEFLDVLGKHSEQIRNNIYSDFEQYLQEIQDQTSSYEKVDMQKWGWFAWQGFLMYLFDQLIKNRVDVSGNKIEIDKYENWHYVNNARGGFWGLYYNWIQIEEGVEIYLQFELTPGENLVKRLCYKVEVEKEDKDLRRAIRNKIYHIAKNIDTENGVKPNFRLGKYMTFWIHDNALFDDCKEIEKFDSIITKAKKAENQLQLIADEYRKLIY